MRDHSHHIEISREEAVSRMLERWDWNAAHEGRVEVVALEESFGRVLAEDVYSKIEAPNTLTCCMDSIAVHWDDFEGGMPDTSEWVRGVDWEFANTGIAMPEGFDTAIVIEHVQVSDDAMRVSLDAAPSKRFAGTRPAGSKMAKGDKLACAGEIVTADVAARIASGNNCSVSVVSKPLVAFIPTGNELVRPGGEIALGKNVETNSFLTRGKIEAWGGVPMVFDIVPDVPEMIEEAVAKAVSIADIVVLNAGSSKGSDDWSVEQLEKMGEVICHQTNHGPGHHSSCSIVAGTPVVGISGPAGGASFTLNFYLLPLMRAFLGLDPEPLRLPARLTADIPGKKPGSHRPAGSAMPGEQRPSVVSEGGVFYGVKYLDITLSEDGVLEATPYGGKPGSPETLGANAFCMVGMGPGMEAPKAGDIVLVELR